MKKQSITILSIGVVAAILLSACGLMSALPNQALNQLDSIANGTANQVSTVAKEAAKPLIAAQAASSATAHPELVAAYEGMLSDIYAQVNPSVVNIRVVSQVSGLTLDSGQSPFNLPQDPNNPDQQAPQVSQALGSGFVWDTQGHIVTNNHVVDGADKIEVTFSDGNSFPATLVGNDPSSDLAVVKVDAAGENLQPVKLADSSQVKVGEVAIAIGNPFGLEGTLTAGIVSSVGRLLPASETATNGQSYSIPDVIQTDAAINPGNSGGVLLNASGEVIGVTAAIESPVRANSGVGFAIPSAIVNRVVPSLIQTGGFEHAYLGISGTELTSSLATAMGLKSTQRGALVETVVPGGPADTAGLHASTNQTQIDGQDVAVGGDVITAIDGQPVKAMDDLITYLSNNTTVGQKVTLTILRDGKETTVVVTLGKRPAEAPQSADAGQLPQLPQQPQLPQSPQQEQPSTNRAWMGINAGTLTPEIAQAMNLPSGQQGVMIAQVEPGSPAEQAGLQGSSTPATLNGQSTLVGGDVITEFDGQPVTSIEELLSAIQQHNPGDKVTLSVLRNGEQVQAELTLAERPANLP